MPNFVESSLFLHQHAAIKQFAQRYTTHFNLSDTAQWSVVCERKEDVTPIRAQIFSEIRAQQGEKNTFCSGISVYTLDQLAQNFCYCLSAITNHDLQKKIPDFLKQPYLDITTQENIIHLILNLFGYVSSDSRAIARQLLILIDLQLPIDTNILELILNSQTHHTDNATQSVNVHSLKQILASLQYAQIELSGYARFQSLVTTYLQGFLFDHLDAPVTRKHFVLPNAFLKGPILWIQAPQYQGKYSYPIKPGHFQRSLVDEFKNRLQQLRKILFQTTDDTFFDSQTIIAHSQEIANRDQIQFYFSQDDFLFYEKARSLFDEPNFVLLGDIDKNDFQHVRPNAGGAYPLSMKDIEAWKKNRFCALELTDATEHPYMQTVFKHLDAAYDADINLFSFLKNIDTLNKISQTYGLKSVSLTDSYFSDLFSARVRTDMVNIEPDTTFQRAQKALSFFSGSSLPEKIIVLGPPHTSVNTSFNVKMLNNTMLFIKKMGVEIELPTSETLYHEFWNHIFDHHIETHFYLEKKSDLTHMDHYVSNPKNNIFPLNQPLNPWPTNTLPNMQRSPHKDSLSVTEFEQYMHCPFKFFFQHVLKITRNKEDSLLPDPAAMGSQMHLLCEQLMGRLVGIFGNQEYLLHMPSLYEAIIHTLKDEELFLSFVQSDWEKAIFATIAAINPPEKNLVQLAFQEAIAHIWQTSAPLQEKLKKPHSPSFSQAQQTELLKRTFLQFLFIEQKNCLSAEKKKVAIFREQPISFALGGLRLTGRIDRIDLCENGFEIIDYKTAKVTKARHEVSLFPSEYASKKKGTLNAQGALYCLGLLKSSLSEDFSHFDDGGAEVKTSSITKVSLYFLKHINNDDHSVLSHTFSEPLTSVSESFSTLEEEYTRYAEKFLCGDFNPEPLLGKEMCNYCDARFFCSLYRKENA